MGRRLRVAWMEKIRVGLADVNGFHVYGDTNGDT